MRSGVVHGLHVVEAAKEISWGTPIAQHVPGLGDRERSAVDFSAFYKQRVPAANGDTGPLLVISTDGKGISMRRSDLREATRKPAEQRCSKLTKRLCKGEKTATRRSSKCSIRTHPAPFRRTRRT